MEQAREVSVLMTIRIQKSTPKILPLLSCLWGAKASLSKTWSINHEARVINNTALLQPSKSVRGQNLALAYIAPETIDFLVWVSINQINLQLVY